MKSTFWMTAQEAERELKAREQRSCEIAAKCRIRATPWFNGLGWDVDDSEVFRCTHNGADILRVFTPDRVALVVSTSDPIQAVFLTRSRGHKRYELCDMDYRDAQSLVQSVML